MTLGNGSPRAYIAALGGLTSLRPVKQELSVFGSHVTWCYCVDEVNPSYLLVSSRRIASPQCNVDNQRMFAEFGKTKCVVPHRTRLQSDAMAVGRAAQYRMC